MECLPVGIKLYLSFVSVVNNKVTHGWFSDGANEGDCDWFGHCLRHNSSVEILPPKTTRFVKHYGFYDKLYTSHGLWLLFIHGLEYLSIVYGRFTSIDTLYVPAINLHIGRLLLILNTLNKCCIVNLITT